MYIEKSSFVFNTLKYLQFNSSVIPCSAGIYKWVYWPNLENFISNEDDYWKMLQVFSSKRIADFSRFSDFKFEITVIESSFKSLCDEDIVPFGISENKSKKLRDYIKSEENRRKFNDFLKSAIFSRPFYVGKADDLHKRLKDHSSGRSKILSQIRSQGINNEDIWVGYFELNVFNEKNDKQINDVFEEIFQRIVKPGLTQRPG